MTSYIVLKKRTKRARLRLALNFARVRNWIAGYSWSPIHRCRTCGHTVYETDRVTRTTCRYCVETKPVVRIGKEEA